MSTIRARQIILLHGLLNHRRWIFLLTTTATLLPLLLLSLPSSSSSATITTTTTDQQQQHHHHNRIDDDNVLNVHIIPHTHDDVGWLKTVDQYYHGRNDTIQRAAVKYILQTIIYALPLNPQRTFTYVEMAFFSRFYTSQPPPIQQQIKTLISNQQLVFANGGWVMHDEATTHVMGMIDQTTLGHDFLYENFGGEVIPTVGWQLDPFGHSTTQARVMTELVGFDGFFFGRIDERERRDRMTRAEGEGIWKTTSSSSDDDEDEEGGGGGVFWGLTRGEGGGYYGPPKGFCLDTRNCPLNNRIDESNALMRAEEFVSVMVEKGKEIKGNDLLILLGGDFNYENAFQNFDSIDTLITTLQTNNITPASPSPYTSVNAFYSTPSQYLQSKISHTWSVKSNDDDFFPYADCPNCYWTGYYTSRPGLKRMERFSSSFLHAARQLDAMYDFSTNDDEQQQPLRTLEEANAVLQHHDGVSGTSKQHVAYDYAKMLSGGLHDAKRYVEKILVNVIWGDDDDDEQQQQQEPPPLVEYCLQANETYCNMSQSATAENRTLYIIVYNALGQPRNDVLSIPVSMDVTYKVTRTQVEVKSELFPNKNYASVEGAAPYILYFETGVVPPVGAVVYKLERIGEDSTVVNPTTWKEYKKLRRREEGTASSTLGDDSSNDDDVGLSNGRLTIYLDDDTGLLSKISTTNDNTSTSIDIKQQWGYYTSFNFREKFPHLNTLDENGEMIPDPKKIIIDELKSLTQNSGAYIFRPSHPNQTTLNLLSTTNNNTSSDDDDVLIYQGTLITEIHTTISPNELTQIIKLTAQKDYVDVHYTLGPIKKHGREIISRYDTSIRNNDYFFTDSNARSFMKRRQRNANLEKQQQCQPIAGNYYPVNTCLAIEDDNDDDDSSSSSSSSISLLTDRSHGGSSLKNGSIEVMIQRRLAVDDKRGVFEALDETDEGINPNRPFGDAKRRGKGVIIAGMQRLVVSGGGGGRSGCRREMDGMYSPLFSFYGTMMGGGGRGEEENDVVSSSSSSFSGLNMALPSNVMLMTFQRRRRQQQQHPAVKTHNDDDDDDDDDDDEQQTFLVRFGHQYDSNEHPELSKPVTIDLGTIFLDFDVTSFVEKTLTGNRDYSEWERTRLVWKTANNRTASHNETKGRRRQRRRQRDDDGMMIQLKPMDIRTFEIVMKKKKTFKMNDDDSGIHVMKRLRQGVVNNNNVGDVVVD